MKLTSAEKQDRHDDVLDYRDRHGCTLAEAVQAVVPTWTPDDRVAETKQGATRAGRPSVTLTQAQFRQLLEAARQVSEVAPAPRTQVTESVMAEAVGQLHELDADGLRTVTGAVVEAQSDGSSPFWTEPRPATGPPKSRVVAPFWRGLDLSRLQAGAA